MPWFDAGSRASKVTGAKAKEQTQPDEEGPEEVEKEGETTEDDTGQHQVLDHQCLEDHPGLPDREESPDHRYATPDDKQDRDTSKSPDEQDAEEYAETS